MFNTIILIFNNFEYFKNSLKSKKNNHSNTIHLQNVKRRIRKETGGIRNRQKKREILLSPLLRIRHETNSLLKFAVGLFARMHL